MSESKISFHELRTHWLKTITFQPELLDELLKGYQNSEDLLGEGLVLRKVSSGAK